MTDDSGLSPPDSSFLHSQHLHITNMDEGTPHSEDLIEEVEEQEDDDGEELFEIDSNEHESDCQHGFGIECDDHENESDQFFTIDTNGNAESEQGFELEGESHGNEPLLKLKGDNTENDALQMIDISSIDREINQENNTSIVNNEDGFSQDKYYPPPVTGMEFESYDDAYNYYNCYAKEMGFAIRVKSSWTKRNSKEKRGAVLCCNCEGFKTFKEATNRRKETRTGCLAMIRLRLVESNRWRVDEVKLEHNHLFDPERVQNSKSHKKMEFGTKRKLEPAIDVEVRTIKLYLTPPAIDGIGSRSFNSQDSETDNHVPSRSVLRLKPEDSQTIQSYFCQKQLRSPNFFYVMDLNDEGQLRNVFWVDSRSRAAYRYFGDVVAIDTTSLSNKYEIPLLSFVGINHHGQSILLGCAFIADETVETYVWLFRTWLTCMSGRPPQTIITDRCNAMQCAISDVFSRAHHRLYLPHVMESILVNLRQLQDFEAFRLVLSRVVYGSLKLDEFETSWGNMAQQFGIRDLEWLLEWYEDRERWAPVYLKDTFLAGLFSVQRGEPLIPFFQVHEQTSVRELFDLYDMIMQKQQKEDLDDLESRGSNPSSLRTRCHYELQLSKLYTKEIFERFQAEVEMMPCSLGMINQVHAIGPVITYMVKEHKSGGVKEFNIFEVMYDKASMEMRCICGGFYLNGYLCRHALSVFNHNGVEEIPLSYILPRWRKDCNRLHVPDIGSSAIDVSNPTQWYEHLHKQAMQLVEAGMSSQDHYTVAWQAFLESLNKARLTVEKNV